MAVTPRKLSLTRDQFSSFLQDFEQIKQFENLFATVDTIANVTLDDINIAAGNADESANDALAQIIALSDTLNKEPNPATVSQLAVIETQLAALNVAPPASLGTVTSVAASGGTTGLTFSGSPITTSGTLTLGGTLAVVNGGTGQTSYTDGQLLIGNTTGNTLTKATLIAGSGVSIANGAGSITISATGSGGTVTSVSVVSANGFAGTVATATTTPAITLSTSVTGLIKGNGTALSAAVAATDYVAPSAYASANGLTMATSRLLGRTTASTGEAEEISVAGGLTLSGGVLTGASGTVTSVGQTFTGGLISVAGSPITTSGTLALTVAGTSGGIPYFSSGTTWATSAALAANAIVVGGGAGLAPATVTTGTGVVTALGVNVGTAGSFIVNGGALGTPSSGTVTNLTGTASININGTVGATTPTTGAFTSVSLTAGSALAWNADVGLSRSAADTLNLGNGTAGSSSGTLVLTKTTFAGNANLTSPSSGNLQLGTGGTTGAGGSLSLTGLTASGTVSANSLTLTTALSVGNGGTGATTLTSGYLVKGNGTSAVSASVVYDDGTNVGIGTAAPGYKLEVAGNTYLNGVIRAAAASSAAAPGYTFAGDPDTGIYRSAANTLGISTNGIVAVLIDGNNNVGIGAAANASAILDVQSTTKGFRLPNMTTAQKNAIATPAAGLMVFDTTLAKACVYSGAAWQTITSV
jgi:hypothetical protein